MTLEGLRLTVSHGGSTHVAFTVDGLRAAGVPETAIRDGVAAVLCREVDAHAERLRGGLITSGAGQAMEYQEVQAQAVAALSGPAAEAIADRYPMLAATVGLDRDPDTGAPAADILGVARSVVAAYRAWQAAGAAIRSARLTGKAAIAAAPTPEAAAIAAAAIAWPTLG